MTKIILSFRSRTILLGGAILLIIGAVSFFGFIDVKGPVKVVSKVEMPILPQKELVVPHESINGDVDKDTYAIFQEIASLKQDQSVNKKNYNACVQLSRRVQALGELSFEGISGALNDIFRICRAIRNKYGSSAEKTRQWQELREIVRQDGVNKLFEKIESMEVPVHFSLQKGEPSHNLFTLLLMENIKDKEAFQTLLNYGVKLNSKTLAYALINNNDTAIDFYIENADVTSSDDMIYSATTSAAAFGELQHLALFLDLGIPLEDKLGRNSFVLYLSKSGRSTSYDELENFLITYRPAISSSHISELKNANLNSRIMELLKAYKTE